MDEIRRYILENRGTYTREAIIGKLLAAGHSRAEIEAAWEEVDAAEPAPPPRPRAWRWFLIYLLGLYALTVILYTPALVRGGLSYIGPLVMVSLLLPFAALWMLIVRVTNVLARNVALAVLVAGLVPFLYLLIIAGLCTVLTGAPFGTSSGLGGP